MTVILGVDPGTLIMGYALLKVEDKNPSVLEIGVEKMTKLQSPYEKLKHIFDSVTALIEKYQPTILAVEAPFFGKNPQSMLKLGRAQGAVIAASLQKGLEIFEFSPRYIKQSITGNGNASKEQVAAMLQQMKLIHENANYLDATDALAAAVCYHLQNRFPIPTNKYSSWDAFLAQNKDRIIK